MTNEIRPNQSNGSFADLPVCSYYVRVQSEDCEASSIEIEVSEPTALVVNPTISNISCSGADDGSILLNAQGGSGNYQYAISPNLNQFSDTNSFDELSPGDYSVIVQDDNGCFELIEFTLTEPSALEVTSTVTDEICFGSSDGMVTLQVSGGTPPYSTAFNSNNDADFVQDLFSYSDLASGTFVVFIRDANGCEFTEIIEVESGVNLAGEAQVSYECDTEGITSNSVTIAFEDSTVSGDVIYGLDTDDPNLMQLDASFENLSEGAHFITVVHSNGCTNTFEFEVTIFDPLTLALSEGEINQISTVATGGSGNYTFYIDGEEVIDAQQYYITETATYAVTVTDENGCSITQEIDMEFIDIEIPNFFTPDNDGQNDIWAPRNIEPYPDIYIKIYDRYGRTIYQFKGNKDGWDGQYQFADLPSGDYWYLIKLRGLMDKRKFVGHFTLYR